MTPQPRIGKISEQEMSEMAVESYRQITGRKPMTKQPQRTLDISRCYDCPHLRDGIRCLLTEQFIVDATKIPASCTLPASRPAPSQCPHYELRDGAYYCRCEYDKEHDAAVAAKAREDKAVEVEQLETSAKQKYEFATTKHEEVYQQGIVMGLQMAIKSLRTGGEPR